MKSKRRIIFIFIFIVYILSVIYITILSKYSFQLPQDQRYPNLTITLFSELNAQSRTYLLKNYLGNVVLFLPFSILFILIKKQSTFKVRTILLTLASGIIFSLFIETIQYYTGYGIFDINDLILNTLGTLIGILLLRILKFYISSKRIPDKHHGSSGRINIS
ncbi:VanZ family protein [Aneurinibacillus thermoaerophilus]|uniref:VanZ family protein n=1 Tax=Aneurinibacillus thermoaerophilus TaxID=143495 RepID=A0ABX8Y8M2_ANETH|nr:VanZ family protein [Aneurinibacillus thermoaerophilus]